MSKQEEAIERISRARKEREMARRREEAKRAERKAANASWVGGLRRR